MNLQTPYIFILTFFVILFIIGIALSLLAKKDATTGNDLEKRVEKALPGVQCAQCGYPGCQAYAQAVIKGEAKIDKCIPGGPDTVNTLASILNIDPQSLNADSDDMLFATRKVALIHKSLCTGCTKCSRVCPVDAINGKVRQIHSVDSEECIGCGDCIKVCPEKCIEMIRLEPTLKNFNWEIESMRIIGDVKR